MLSAQAACKVISCVVAVARMSCHSSAITADACVECVLHAVFVSCGVALLFLLRTTHLRRAAASNDR